MTVAEQADRAAIKWSFLGDVGVDEMATRSWNIANQKGFHNRVRSLTEYLEGSAYAHENPNIVDDIARYEVARKLFLIVSELVEGLEAIRKAEVGDGGNLAEELADAVIRIGDLFILAQELGLIEPEMTLSFAIQHKQSINEGRPQMHNRRF